MTDGGRGGRAGRGPLSRRGRSRSPVWRSSGAAARTPAPDPGEDGALPQLASSLLSWQSLSPSQMKAGLVQMPVEHWNCPGRHLNSAAGRGR